MRISNTIPVYPSVSGKGTPPFRAYRINEKVTIHENDEGSARMDEAMRTGHPRVFKAKREQLDAARFSVEKIYD